MRKRLSFRFNWKLTVFSLFFFLSFLNLGFWQLDRKDEKLRLIEKNLELRSSEGLTGSFIKSGLASGTPVTLHGSFDKEIVLLLDNKTLNGAVGFELLQLFSDDSGSNFLVNRGFLVGGKTRSSKIEIPAIDRSTRIVRGYLYQDQPNPYALDLSKVDFKFPQIVQGIQIGELSKQIMRDIFPFVIRLEKNEQGALPRNWQTSSTKPEKHQAYAVQWFLMGLAIFIAWVSFTFRIKRDDQSPN